MAIILHEEFFWVFSFKPEFIWWTFFIIDRAQEFIVSLKIPLYGLKFYASTLEVFDDLLLAVLSEVFGFQISTKKINWLSYEASLFVAVQTHEFFKDIEENYSVANALILLVLELLFV